MKKNYMYWWQIGDKKQNFGDILGHYLVERLSGLKFSYVPVEFEDGFIDYLRYFYYVLRGHYTYESFFNLVLCRLTSSTPLITIGSVIGFYKKPNYYNVWGSGIMNKNTFIQNANFIAVRGKYTQKRLGELGYNVPDVIGDPALLLPLVYNPEVKKIYKLGIIPHFLQFEEVTKLIMKNDILIINLLEDIEKVIRDIKACDYIISSSLHGIIVAHAYSIPSLWYDFPGGKIGGDNVKFFDYFSSVDIENYESFKIEDYENFDVDEISENVKNNCEIDTINSKVIEIQRGLMQVAPFEIIQKYKDKINI